MPTTSRGGSYCRGEVGGTTLSEDKLTVRCTRGLPLLSLHSAGWQKVEKNSCSIFDLWSMPERKVIPSFKVVSGRRVSTFMRRSKKKRKKLIFFLIGIKYRFNFCLWLYLIESQIGRKMLSLNFDASVHGYCDPKWRWHHIEWFQND